MGEKYYQYTGIFEFTNRLSWNAFLKNKKTLFEKTLAQLGIEYQVIKPHTPGRVERNYRKDRVLKTYIFQKSATYD